MSRSAGGQLVERMRRLRVAARRPKVRTPVLEAETVITLRLVGARDGDGSIAQLVELSGEASPAGPSLLAEVNGEPWAALSLHDGQLLSDPFHPSVELGSLLTLRLAQLAASPRTLATPRSA